MSLDRARAKLRTALGPASPREAHERQALDSIRYGEIEVELDAGQSACWCWMNPQGAPSFTPGLLRDISAHQRAIRQAFAEPAPDGPPLKYWVLASRLPGIFNLGGDLDLFRGWIRAQDREGLRNYARACIDVLHENAIGFDQSVITVALVQGDALGGGFEAALSCDMIVAERGAKFGLPEILFNLFPGMGAYSLLARRVGMAEAEKIIASGKLYSAEELHERGLVQALAEPGDGVAETHRLLSRNLRRHNGLSALFRAGRRVAPLLYDELRDITDIWVDAALQVEESDLRKMGRLTAAQDRRLQAGSAAYAAE
ncbi:crotonase/enoyl-CoA hydratase family protein [Hansschlegelia sp.]|uniref:crotonase/enoyl-CoA hydratase family protein n=1 Tax=Hansschlegelia sp. TaxID=2041892 RepID=UPI002B56E861|nr:crotonase/enoyl-CoA hydratase family protein [Hansschlegelia sp.]HVI28026.1 crotonase/enoyl-CoA hydratase family protein [Hansschlegelia sp.]